MWFDIIGNSLAFIGSVIFSAGLLQTREQVKAANSTYFNTNPYTMQASLSSMRKNQLAFFLVVTGFAITLGGSIGEAASLGVDMSLMICVMAAFAGYFTIFLIYLVNQRQHRELQAKLSVYSFYAKLRSSAEKNRRIVGQSNERTLFALYRQADLTEIRACLNAMLMSPKDHMNELVLTLARKRVPSKYVLYIEQYLRAHAREVEELDKLVY